LTSLFGNVHLPPSPIAQTRLLREIAFLKQMDHPFVSEFFQHLDTPENVFLVMEYVENGNMLD
jgi:serine/threonine protein kinase